MMTNVDMLQVILTVHNYVYMLIGTSTTSSVIEGKWRIYALLNEVIIGLDNDLPPGRPPSHYLNQRWPIMNLTQRNKPYSQIFIEQICNWKYRLRQVDHFASGPVG